MTEQLPLASFLLEAMEHLIEQRDEARRLCEQYAAQVGVTVHWEDDDPDATVES